jgi:ADP-ribose pyrophosphatase YjhB (NUDIX family)
MAVIGATQLEPVNILGSYVQGLEGARANRLARIQEEAALREMQEKTALRNTLSQATAADLADPAFLNRLAITPGGASTAQALSAAQASQRTAEKTNLEIKAERLKQANEQVGRTMSLLRGALKDPASYPMRLQMASDMGYDISQFPQVFNADTAKRIQASVDELIPVATQIENELKDANAKRDDERLKLEKRRVESTEATERRIAGEATDRSIVARTETAADGTVRFYNKFGDLIKTDVGAGKPSATFEKNRAIQQQTVRDIDYALTTLKEVSKAGGLIEKSTGSGAGRLADVAAAFVGVSTPGSIAISKLQPLADTILKIVPRFEGPQSDADRQSYLEASGQLANASLPVKNRLEAANTLIDLFTRRKGQFTIDAGSETAPNIQAILDKYPGPAQ